MQVPGDPITVLEDGHLLGRPAVLGQLERDGRLRGEGGQHVRCGLRQRHGAVPAAGRQDAAHPAGSAERHHDERAER